VNILIDLVRSYTQQNPSTKIGNVQVAGQTTQTRAYPSEPKLSIIRIEWPRRNDSVGPAFTSLTNCAAQEYIPCQPRRSHSKFATSDARSWCGEWGASYTLSRVFKGPHARQ
jgi:hypothetical protein